MRGGLHGDQGASRWVAGDLADIDSQRCTTDQARPGAVNTAAALFNNNYRGVAHSAARSLARTRRPRVESRSRRVPRGASRGRLSRSVMGKRRCGPLLLASTGRLCGGAPLEHWSVLHRSHDATANSISANSTASLSSFVCPSVPCITSARHAGQGIVTVTCQLPHQLSRCPALVHPPDGVLTRSVTTPHSTWAPHSYPYRPALAPTHTRLRCRPISIRCRPPRLHRPPRPKTSLATSRPRPRAPWPQRPRRTRWRPRQP
jgi:hypothetical protein